MTDSKTINVELSRDETAALLAICETMMPVLMDGLDGPNSKLSDDEKTRGVFLMVNASLAALTLATAFEAHKLANVQTLGNA